MILDVGNYPKFKTVVQAKPRSICCHLEVKGCFWFSLCELPKFSVTQVSEAPSYPSLVPFVLFCLLQKQLWSCFPVPRQSGLSLWGTRSIHLVVTLYLQCLQRPPGGRGRAQETIGFGHKGGFLPRLQICLESRCGCSDRHLGSLLRMQCSSPFPASPPSGYYLLTFVSLGKHSTWTSRP